MSEGGGGSGINSVIEAEFRARDLGAPRTPDAADERAEFMVGRVTLGLGMIGAIAVSWLFFGLGAAAVVTAALAVIVLIAWSVAKRRRPADSATPADNAP
ncbi:MAG TPA: hypothetical protein VFB69_00680 [Candidatus Dormibacteraeota bacterium]|nr:hypothetical protein [Candidatus Dormibacteraeota bacterium]